MLEPGPSSSNPNSSIPNCSARTFQSCFHWNASPLLQLKASFAAHGFTAAQICCSAIKSASETAEYDSHASFVPKNFNGRPSCLQIAAYTQRVPTRFIKLYGEKPKMVR